MQIKRALGLLTVLAGCSSGEGEMMEPMPTPNMPIEEMRNERVLCEPHALACANAMLSSLNLQSTVAPGTITNDTDGVSILSVVDARAGGAFAENPDSFVYARFTDTSLEKVELSDQEALTSLDWDVAFRRYIIRVNSADSGPSCTKVGRIPGATSYDTADASAAVGFQDDDLFTDSCDLIPDGSGIDASPATALSSYFTFSGCLKMSNNVFVIERRDGRKVKFTVLGYYGEAAQEACNHHGEMLMDGSAAKMRLRWAFEN